MRWSEGCWVEVRERVDGRGIRGWEVHLVDSMDAGRFEKNALVLCRCSDGFVGSFSLAATASASAICNRGFAGLALLHCAWWGSQETLVSEPLQLPPSPPLPRHLRNGLTAVSKAGGSQIRTRSVEVESDLPPPGEWKICGVAVLTKASLSAHPATPMLLQCFGQGHCLGILRPWWPN